MKNIFKISVIVSLLILGCSDQSNFSSNPVQKKANYSLIKLPAPKGLQVNNIYSDTKEIDGSIGGTLSLSGCYNGGPFGTLSVTATLEFPSGSFEGKKTLSMTADDEYCASSFQPGVSFSKAGVYNITYTGVDLSGINPSTVKFVYLRNDGSLEYPLHEGIIVDLAVGKISIQNAKLNHFSRYGFVN